MLFTPLPIGSLTIPNRIILAPLTRTRADAGHMPNDLMAEYYSQRASGGLLITECTMVAPNTSAFINEPGIYNDAQIAAWKKVTAAVHAKGGRIFMQIWHAGRAAHPDMNDGAPTVSSSATAIDGEAKLMVSTVAAGDIAPFVGVTDITLMPSVVDVAGINRIIRQIYANADGAMAGMV